MSNSLSKIAKEVAAWFFDDYVPTWVAAARGADGDFTFILRYWGVPLYTDCLGQNSWVMDPRGILDFLDLNQGPLRALGYTHTALRDRKVTAYSENGAGIDVIWSRRRSDDSEIERLAVHFGVARTSAGWRVITINAWPTTEDKLDAIWRATG